MYLIELSNQKVPSEMFLGARRSKRLDDGSLFVIPDSVRTHNDGDFDGYINRNIRLAMAIIESAKPYIEIVSVGEMADNTAQYLVEWKVNGCYFINTASTVVNKEETIHIKEGADPGSCNYYLVTQHEKQHTFTFVMERGDNVELRAVVDQEFGKSVNLHNVEPNEFTNDPRLHLSRMRLDDEYYFSHNGKVIYSNRIITHKVELDELLPLFEVKEQGNKDRRVLLNAPAPTAKLIVTLQQFSSNVSGEVTFEKHNETHYNVVEEIKGLPTQS
mmetsp:Transcript_11442/g.11451  ORF Transcript_11442/g.11451 Transcript_11442/m.11451 type:complete len:273 (+) Transcript_11442:1051-1869(+)